MQIKIKRVYETPESSDGKRVLIDRLWPRGLTKEKAKVDLWLKEIAPSTELRKWFNHDPARWDEFRRKYAKEISNNTAVKAQLELILKKGGVTLVYSAKDELHNDAIVLKDYFSKVF